MILDIRHSVQMKWIMELRGSDFMATLMSEFNTTLKTRDFEQFNGPNLNKECKTDKNNLQIIDT